MCGGTGDALQPEQLSNEELQRPRAQKETERLLMAYDPDGEILKRLTIGKELYLWREAVEETLENRGDN